MLLCTYFFSSPIFHNKMQVYRSNLQLEAAAMLNTETHSLHHIDQFLTMATSSNILCISMYWKKVLRHHTLTADRSYITPVQFEHFIFSIMQKQRKRKHKREIMVAFQLICPQVMLHKIFCPSFILNDHMMVRTHCLSPFFWLVSTCLFVVSRRVNTYRFSVGIASTHFHLENYLPIKWS